jgi:hypothetical protein
MIREDEQPLVSPRALAQRASQARPLCAVENQEFCQLEPRT